MRSQRGARRTMTAIGAALVGGLLMTGCGTASADRPGASSGASTSAADPSAAARDRQARAKSHFIPVAAMGSTWRLSDPPPPGFRMSVCGVDIEPEAPLGSARQRFAQTGVGPFLGQYVQVHRNGLPSEVVAKVKAALPGCTTFTTDGDGSGGAQVRFDIQPADFGTLPQGAVAFRMRAQSQTKVTQDIALIARGDCLVGLVSVAFGRTPDPAVLTKAIAAVP